jgi:threonine/homoserine/homoserine lactone efflux protein
VTGFVITATYGALAGLLGTKLSAKMALMNKLSALLLGALAVRLAWN